MPKERQAIDVDGPPPPELEPGTLVIADQSLKLGFIQLPRLVLHARNLTRDAKLLYAILLGYAWQEGRCFPGYARLCYDMGASENTVRQYMRELEAVDLLRQRRRGLGKTNIYTLLDLRTAKIEVQEPAKTTAADPAKTAGELETEIIETDRKDPDIISNIKNSTFSPSKSDTELSTSLRAQTNGSQHPPDLRAAEISAIPTGSTAIREVLSAKGLLHPSPSDTNQPPPIPTGHSTRQPPSPTEGGAGAGLAGAAQTVNATPAAAASSVHEAPRRRGRPPKARADAVPTPAFISNVITDFTRLFNDDEQAIRSNLTQATNLWQRSGLSEVEFVQQVLYPARSLTQQARVTKRATNGLGPNRMPYYFRVVRDLVEGQPRRQL